jgi:hypothetical protein
VRRPSQVVIGAIGKIQRVPRYESDKSDKVVPTHIMNVSDCVT